MVADVLSKLPTIVNQNTTHESIYMLETIPKIHNDNDFLDDTFL